MIDERIGMGLDVRAGAGLRAGAAIGGLAMRTRFKVVCRGRDGTVKWTDDVHNLVHDDALNDLLAVRFKASAYTSDDYIGLKAAGTIAAGDNLASHAGWAEVTDYTGDRKALVPGTVSGQSLDNSGSPAEFVFTAAVTVAGCFIATVATGTAGVLYGTANFSVPRDMEIDDKLEITATLTASDDS